MKSSARKIRNVLRHGLIVQTALDALCKSGIEISLYHLYRDKPFDADYRPPAPDLEDIETMFFGPEEFEEIGKTPGNRDSWEYLLGLHGEGKRCFGLKSRGEVVSYIWFEPYAATYLGHDIRLAPEEVFIFGTYTMRRWRGQNAATWMRYELTKRLAAMDKTKFCNVISYFNTPAIRIKAKMNPHHYFLYLHLGLFGRWSRQWLLKEYGGEGTGDENQP